MTPTTGARAPRTQIYLCVEGATEREYVNALNQYRYMSVFAPQFLGGTGSKTHPHSSLLNLIRTAQREEKAWSQRERESRTIWIVCDVDENRAHLEELRRWLENSPERHRVALQDPAIECWFLQHFERSSRPAQAKSALHSLLSEWPLYAKAGEIPRWLIDRTDDELKRERDYVWGRPSKDEFPLVGSSQLPQLIAHLDGLAAQLSRKA